MSISKRRNVAKGEMSIRVYLLPELKDKFKTACFLKRLNMSDVTAALIEEWLAKNPVDLLASPRISKALTETGSADRVAGLQPTETEPAETPTERLHLSVRGYNCLKEAKIYTVAELLTHTAQSLLAIKNVDQKVVDEIVVSLQRLGFYFAPEPEPEPAPTAKAKRGKGNKEAN